MYNLVGIILFILVAITSLSGPVNTHISSNLSTANGYHSPGPNSGFSRLFSHIITPSR